MEPRLVCRRNDAVAGIRKDLREDIKSKSADFYKLVSSKIKKNKKK